MGHLYNLLDLVMTYALAPSVTAVRVGWSRSQERVLRSGVLWDWLHSSRSDSAAQGDDGLARPERRALQVNRIRGDLEQLVRVGGFGRLNMA